MKFPISRDTLQAFDLEKEKAEMRELRIQEHVDNLIKGICDRLEKCIMGYSEPVIISNNTSYESPEDIQKKIIRDKRFIWDQLRFIKMSNSRGPYIYLEESVLIERLIQKLKETFVDCKITIDPLKVYLVIDWS